MRTVTAEDGKARGQQGGSSSCSVSSLFLCCCYSFVSNVYFFLLFSAYASAGHRIPTGTLWRLLEPSPATFHTFKVKRVRIGQAIRLLPSDLGALSPINPGRGCPLHPLPVHCPDPGSEDRVTSNRSARGPTRGFWPPLFRPCFSQPGVWNT